MSLELFFDPVDESLLDEVNHHSSWSDHIYINVNQLPDWKNADIALIGVNEYRGSGNGSMSQNPADQVRRKLYGLRKGSGSYNVVDLGNLRNGPTLADTGERLRELCETLFQQCVIPVVFGGSHDLDIYIYQAYESLQDLISMVNVDQSLDMEELTSRNDHQHIRNILLHEPNYLFNYSLIGYQSYLAENEFLGALESLQFETYRLGLLHENIEEMEPVLRGAEMLSFDLNAIRMQDAPAVDNPLPFGLTGEQACQLMWYAGLSDKLTSVGVFNFYPEKDNNGATAMIIGTMIWYFVDGYYHRKKNVEPITEHYIKYRVTLSENPHELVFYKDKLTEKWWMEVPVAPGKRPYDRSMIVPCSYKDYQEATQGDIPDKWITAQSKLL